MVDIAEPHVCGHRREGSQQRLRRGRNDDLDEGGADHDDASAHRPGGARAGAGPVIVVIFVVAVVADIVASVASIVIVLVIARVIVNDRRQIEPRSRPGRPESATDSPRIDPRSRFDPDGPRSRAQIDPNSTPICPGSIPDRPHSVTDPTSARIDPRRTRIDPNLTPESSGIGPRSAPGRQGSASARNRPKVDTDRPQIDPSTTPHGPRADRR